MLKLSEQVDRKFIESFELDDLDIWTDTGWHPVTHIHKTIPYEEWVVITDDGYELICADTHILFDSSFNEIFVKDLNVGDLIVTENTLSRVAEVYKTDNNSNMYDLTVDSLDHRFYSNGILSHNSTFLDALTYALFGKPFRKVNKPQLHNSITRKGLLVEVEMKINGVPFLIRRGDRPGIFEVIQDGKLLNQNAKNVEYQEVLEKQIIKCNYKSFCQIVILGSATYQPFMGLPAGNRREIIEDLLDLQIFTVMNKLLVQKVNDNNTSINDSNNKKKIIEEKIKIIRQHISELQESNEKIISEKKERVVETNKLIDHSNEQISNLISKVDDLKESISDFSSISKKSKKLETLKHQISSKLENTKKELEFFNHYNNCPTCKQDIDEVFKHETILSKSGKIDDISSGLTKLDEEYSKVSNRLDDITRVNKEIIELNLQLSAINTKVGGWLDYVNDINHEINNIRTTSNNIDTSNLTNLETELIDVVTEIDNLYEDKKLFNIAGMLLKDGGIKSKIVKQYIPIINKLINKYLATMDFFVNFDLDENFNETIKSRHRDEFSYSSFSEGEKMKINLAILFTWRAIAKLRNSINTNLLIMDEVLDGSIDSNAKDAFFSILGTMEGTNVFVISHAGDALFDKFNSVIRFEKVKNFSRIHAQ